MPAAGAMAEAPALPPLYMGSSGTFLGAKIVRIGLRTFWWQLREIWDQLSLGRAGRKGLKLSKAIESPPDNRFILILFS